MATTPNFILEAAFVGQIDLSFCAAFPLDFAAQQEEQIMIKLLGYHLYSLTVEFAIDLRYVALMEGAEWTDSAGVVRKHEGITLIADYMFYYHWVKELQGEQTGKGMIEPFTDGGEPSLKQLNEKAVRNYAIAEVWYQQTIDYINFKNSETADYYAEFQPMTIEKVNTLGI